MEEWPACVEVSALPVLATKEVGELKEEAKAEESAADPLLDSKIIS
jgi:hypothetical protein